MGLASALSTALTGMTAAETTIDVVGNNLANSNTVGFKASNAAFATQFLQTLALGSGPTDTTGGTNPRQIGLGTTVASITPNFSQGTIQISSSSTDLAIQGEGFFSVQADSGETLYTRNGQFKMNADNELVTQTGNRVLGYDSGSEYDTLQPISIPLGTATTAEQTQNVYLEGALTPDGDVGTQGTVLDSDIMADAAFSRPDTFTAGTSALLSATPASFTAIPKGSGGSMSIGDKYAYRLVFVDSSGTESAYVTVPTVPDTIAANSSSVDLASLPTQAGKERRIYRTDSSGTGDYYRVADIPATSSASTTWTDTGAAGGVKMNDDTIRGSYTYYVTFVDSSGRESRPSVKIVAPAMSTDGRVQLTDLPTSTTGQWTKMRIYRNAPTSSSGDIFYLAGEVNDVTTAHQTWTDCSPDDTIDSGAVLDFYGSTAVRASNTTLATNLLRRDGDNWIPVFGDGGTFSFSGQKGGRALTTKSMSIVKDATTLSSVVQFMSDAMGIQNSGDDPTIPPDASGENPGVYIEGDGVIRFVGNSGTNNGLKIDLSGMQLSASGSSSTVQLPFTATQDANGQSAVTDFIAYDSLGSQVHVRLTAVLESRSSESTVYRWYADSPDNLTSSASDEQLAVGTGEIRFDGDGNFISYTRNTVVINRQDIAARTPMSFNLDFNSISGLASDSSNLAVSRQDGSAPGTLSSFTIGEDGLIKGVFSNGVTRELAQLILARFSNPSGLAQTGNNLYTQSSNSGLPVYGKPSEYGLGTIVAGATELSNTDIGGSLIDLITASTMYRGNTRVITTIQQMLDELLNLRR